jgi:hypothetical protein
MELIHKIIWVIIKITEIIMILLIIIIFLFFLYNNRSYFSIKNILKKNNKKRIEDKINLLNKPLKEFYINSSHNSYISSIQNGSILYKNTISKVLQTGARCIEIDIHDLDGEPVIGHGNKKILTTTHLPLETILDGIVNEGFKTSDPLILFLEVVNTNPIVMEKINNLIKEKFKNKLLDKKYKMNYEGNDKKDIINTPIKDLLNKIIIFNSTSNNSGLEDILDNSEKLINSSTSSVLSYTNDSIRRVYMSGSFLSMMSNNFDPSPYWEKRTNMVVLNFNSNDPYLYKNIKLFEEYNFIHFSEYP